MTREDAIYEIKQLAVLSTNKNIERITEALNMAIEALQDEIWKDEPCNECVFVKGSGWCDNCNGKPKGLDALPNSRKTEPTISKMEQVETMSCQECKHSHENAVMYLDQCDFCFKDCKYEPKDEPQTIRCPKCGRSDYIREFGKDFSVTAEESGFKYKCINCNTYIEPQSDRKTENSSEKPNNSTISKMEQVDKDINVRSKDCTTCKHAGEIYEDPCELCYRHSHYEPKTEPQTYVINLQEPTNDEKCFECDDFFTCGGQCNKIEEAQKEDPCKECVNKTDCPWK